jgi:hypothetical protein
MRKLNLVIHLESGRMHRRSRNRNAPMESGEPESGAPDALLDVERREHYRFVMNTGGVAVDGGGGLSAQVAIAGIEIERADVVRAARAGKLHATLNPRDGVMPLHNSECSLLRREG